MVNTQIARYADMLQNVSMIAARGEKWLMYIVVFLGNVVLSKSPVINVTFITSKPIQILTVSTFGSECQLLWEI